MIETLIEQDVLADMKDYRRMKGRLVVRPYPADAHGVEGSIHKKVGDIALVLYAVLHEENRVLVGAKIPTFLEEAWGMPGEELLETAFKNSMEKDPPRIMDILGILDDPEGYTGVSLEEFGRNGIAPFVSHCLTTENKMNGAAAAFMPGVAKRIAEAFDSDFYLVFTSVHEAMIHPVEEINQETLQLILEDTIKATTAEEDVLTHRVYRYFKDKDEIGLA